MDPMDVDEDVDRAKQDSMDVDEDDGPKKIEELFKKYQALHAKSYPSSSIDFDKLNLTLRVKQSRHAIGMGHHSDVYKGRFDGSITVGVKMLRLPIYDPLQERLYQSVLLRFFRELNHWHELDHINVARLLGFTLSRGNLGFVSLWYPRGNLSQHIVKSPKASRPDLMLDVAEGVNYLHTLPESIIHGDLKGANILVTERGIACLADFGISKQISDLNRQTGFSTTSGITGTTPWMAPELFSDAPLTRACDVYSYAGVLLEICCPGKYPYHYMTQDIRIALAKSQGKLPSRAHYQELDGHDTLWDLITTCLAHNPPERHDITSVVRILYKEYSLSPRVDQTVTSRPKLHAIQGSAGGDLKVGPTNDLPNERTNDPGNPKLAYSTGSNVEARPQLQSRPQPAGAEDTPSTSRSHLKLHGSRVEGTHSQTPIIQATGGKTQWPYERAAMEPEKEQERNKDIEMRVAEMQDRDRTQRNPLGGQLQLPSTDFDITTCLDKFFSFKPPSKGSLSESSLHDGDDFIAGGLDKEKQRRATAPHGTTPFLPYPVFKPSRYTMAYLMDLDPKHVPSGHQRNGSDWYAIFNPQVVRTLDINLVMSFGHESAVCCVRFSNDGKYLATGYNRTTQIYNTRTGLTICVLADEHVYEPGNLYIRSICFSPDGKLLATGADDKRVRIWDIATGKIRQVFNGHTQEIHSLDFSQDGRKVVSSSGDKTARIWDMENGECTLLAHLDPDTSGTGAASATDLFVELLGNMVKVDDASTGHLIERLEKDKDTVYSVTFTPDGQGLASGSLDKNLKYWNLDPLIRGSDRPQPLLQGGSMLLDQQPTTKHDEGQGNNDVVGVSKNKDYIVSAAVSHDDAYVVSVWKDRGVQFWDRRSSQTLFMLQGHKSSVVSIDLCPDALDPGSGYLATGSGDGQARIWHYLKSVRHN